MLLSETEEKIKEWYLPDTIGMQSPIVDIQFCDILAKVKGRVLRFKADRNKCVENNILVATAEAHKYRVISLQRVFDVDVMQNDSRQRNFSQRYRLIIKPTKRL